MSLSSFKDCDGRGTKQYICSDTKKRVPHYNLQTFQSFEKNFEIKGNPELHPDLAMDCVIGLTGHGTLTKDDIEKQYNTLRAGLTIAKGKWMASGNGKNMSVQEGNGGIPEKEVYKFRDGDDRKELIVGLKSFILALWEVAHSYELLKYATKMLPESE